MWYTWKKPIRGQKERWRDGGMGKSLLLLLYTATWAVSVSDGFNIDVTNPETFSGSEEDFFGYRVLQYQSDASKQIIVSAPLRRSTNEKASGAVYSCTLNTANCTLLYQQDSDDVQFFGMSMAVRSTPSSGLTSCSPSLAHDCHGNSYLNGICYHFNSRLDPIANDTVAFQECRKNVVNLVFLFDGSSSMKTSDFNKNKKFIWDIMIHLKNLSIQFAAVQFSGVPRIVFNFNDYKNGTAQKKLDEEEHMKDLTHTHQAIDFVLVNLFNNVSSGADPDATKALVIITDGTPTDFNTKDVIKRCEDQQIIRFVIGAGNVDVQKLRRFSSEPKESNTFQIEDYSGLEGLLDKLLNKIYSIEGDQSVGHREWTKELSQSGFSAVYDKDVLVLGAVGLNEWRGMLYEVGSTEIEIKDPRLNSNSYMGYSTAVGQRGGVSLLFSGAPRSNYKGQVTLFSKHINTWDVTTSVSGEQVGSYFGSSLCLLDVDSDGDTDFLVVGAPLYYQAELRREGRMYVYRLTDEMILEKELEVADSVQGQFAATVTSVADLNGDELQDVAVGAPLEDDGRGAVYIYLGNRTQGIRSQYSQRILARTISENLQQFGVAIHGVMDMEGDGLTDIVVGARGTVMLLKAQPVLSVSAHLSFSPSEILDNFDCLVQTDDTIEVVTLSTCFSVEEKTNSTGAVSSGLNVSYELRADTARTWSSRAFFLPKDKTSRSLLNSVLLDSHYSCFNHTVHMPKCVTDTVSPVLIRLNFSQAGQQPSSSSAVLNIDSRTTANVEIPFQRNCGNVSCVADLELDFDFLSSTLLVVDQSYFIIMVSLLNKGDDSFNTSVELHHPEGLSLSKFDTIKASRRTLSSCGDQDDGALNKTTCTIGLPVYRKGTSATFRATFRISGSYDWSDTMEMTLVPCSSNNGNQTNGTVTKTLPVQFAVDVAVSLEQCVTYLNFSLEDKGPKPVDIVYMVRNLGFKGLPVSVKFIIPSQIGQNFILEQHTITVPQNLTDCSIRMEKDPALCLKQMNCVKFECPSFCLDKESAVTFELKAQLTYLNPQHYTGRWSIHKFSLENRFSSFAELDFDRRRYSQTSNGQQDDATKFHQAQVSVRAELVIPPNWIFIVCSGAAGGLLLLIVISVLLWKSGFFKRKKYEVARAKLEKSRMQVKFIKTTKINDD